MAPSAYPLGGVQTWLDYLLPGLRQLGWRCTLGLVAGRFHDPDAYLAVHPGSSVVAIASRTGTQEGRIRSLAGCIARLRPDLVASVNVPDCHAAVARARRRGVRVRTVMTMHGLQADYYEDMAATASKLDAVVCTNRLAWALSTEIGGIEPRRAHYAPYGVGLDRGTPRPASQTGGTPFRVAFVGRLARYQKRVEDLPRIAHELDRLGHLFELVIAGSGPDEGWLRQALAVPLANGKVRFLGSVAADRLADEVYSGADALLITSSWETGPIVAWEAMAAGVPVVTSAYIGSGLEGSLQHGETCLVFPIGAAAAAAACIARLHRSSALRGKLAAGGRKLIEERYSCERSVAQWSAVLSQIAAAPPITRVAGPSEPEAASSGRLDRVLGVAWGETMRGALGRRFVAASAGSEWPHSYGTTPLDDPDFWRLAAALDGRGTARHDS